MSEVKQASSCNEKNLDVQVGAADNSVIVVRQGVAWCVSWCNGECMNLSLHVSWLWFYEKPFNFPKSLQSKYLRCVFQMRFHSPQNISVASQQNSIATLFYTTRVDGDLFKNVNNNNNNKPIKMAPKWLYPSPQNLRDPQLIWKDKLIHPVKMGGMLTFLA